MYEFSQAKDKFTSLQSYTSRMEAYDQAFKRIRDKEASDDVDSMIHNLKMFNELFSEKGRCLSILSEQIAALEVKLENSRKDMVAGLVYSAQLNNKDKQTEHELNSTRKAQDGTLAKLAQYHAALNSNARSINRVVGEEISYWSDTMAGQYGSTKLLLDAGEDPAVTRDVIRTKTNAELLGSMEVLIHRLITYEYMSFGAGSAGLNQVGLPSSKEEVDDQQPDTDAEDGNLKAEESELNIQKPAESTHDITAPNQKIRKLISLIKVDDLDTVELPQQTICLCNLFCWSR